MGLHVAYAGGIGFALALALALPMWDHLRHAFYRWRLDRRLARNPYMLREEHRDYLLAMGEDPGPIGPALWGAAAGGLFCAGAAWAIELKMEDLWEAAGALACVIVAARSLWRLLNDPNELLAEADPDNTPAAQRLWAALTLVVTVVTGWMIVSDAGWL